MKATAPGLAIALTVLVVSNALVLVHVAANRRGAPDAQMELTSRELALSWRDSEDSRVSLTLRWQNLAPEYGAPEIVSAGWFDERKLRDVGFNLGVAAASADAGRYYRNQRQRAVYVALEMDAPALDAWFARRNRPAEVFAVRQGMTPDQQLEVARRTESHLAAVDAGVDPAALRRAHPDRARVLILPAVARLLLDEARPATANREASPARLRGAISRLSIAEINVPQPLSGSFAGLRSPQSWSFNRAELTIEPIAYTVTLDVGSKYEPWIVDVKRLR